MSSQYRSLIKKQNLVNKKVDEHSNFGPPGAGKGTQSNFIAKNLNYINYLPENY